MATPRHNPAGGINPNAGFCMNSDKVHIKKKPLALIVHDTDRADERDRETNLT